MPDNNSRYDLSDRLIHFFRNIDLSVADAPAWPEDLSHASIAEDEHLKPQFLLRHAIRLGRLYATWSVRKGRRTIHGLRPAVCFTEMPISAFIEAARIREAAGQAMSPYALVFPKAAAFSVGARPVIYALSGNAYADGGTGDTPRLLSADVLPLDEQYRYVAFNPTKGSLDWSHEREWRWKLPTEPWQSEDGGPPIYSDDLPGLNLDEPSLKGLGIIVKTAAEAEQVVYDVLTKADRGDIAPDHYTFVLAHETIQDWDTLRDSGALEVAIQNNLIDLSHYFEITEERTDYLVDQLSAEVESVIQDSDPPATGEPGGCWLWLLENGHEFTRAMLRAGLARVSETGKYLVPMRTFGYRGYNLRQRETMTTDLADRLRQTFGIRTGYFSVLGSEDPNGLPSYNTDHLDDSLFYNWNI